MALSLTRNNELLETYRVRQVMVRAGEVHLVAQIAYQANPTPENRARAEMFETIFKNALARYNENLGVDPLDALEDFQAQNPAPRSSVAIVVENVCHGIWSCIERLGRSMGC